MPAFFEIPCGSPSKASWTMVPIEGDKTVCLVDAPGYAVDLAPKTSHIAFSEESFNPQNRIITFRASKPYSEAILLAKKGGTAEDVLELRLVALPKRVIQTAFFFLRDNPPRQRMSHKSTRSPASLPLLIKEANLILEKANVQIERVSGDGKPVTIGGDLGDTITDLNGLRDKLKEHRKHGTHCNVFFVWKMPGEHGNTWANEMIITLNDHLGGNDAASLAHEMAHLILGNKILPSRREAFEGLPKSQQSKRAKEYIHSGTSGELLYGLGVGIGSKIRRVDAVEINRMAARRPKYYGAPK